MNDHTINGERILITVVNVGAGNVVSAELSGDERVVFQLPHGRIKIRAGDDHLTGHFSSTKRVGRDSRGIFRAWRECDLDALVLPGVEQDAFIALEDVPYEILVFGSRGLRDSPEMVRHFARSADYIERFAPHPHGAECGPGCDLGVWTADASPAT